MSPSAEDIREAFSDHHSLFYEKKKCLAVQCSAKQAVESAVVISEISS